MPQSQQFQGFFNYNYGYDLAPFVAGQVTDLVDRVTITANSLVALRFGVVIVPSIDHPGTWELPSADNLNFDGVLQMEHLDRSLTEGELKFPAKWPLPLLKRGRIAVQIDDDVMTVSPSDSVYVRHTANGSDKQPGQIRKDNTLSSIWESAKFTGRIIPGKLAEISLLLN